MGKKKHKKDKKKQDDGSTNVLELSPGFIAELKAKPEPELTHREKADVLLSYIHVHAEDNKKGVPTDKYIAAATTAMAHAVLSLNEKRS